MIILSSQILQLPKEAVVVRPGRWPATRGDVYGALASAVAKLEQIEGSALTL